jgi:hypothetical protein
MVLMTARYALMRGGSEGGPEGAVAHDSHVADRVPIHRGGNAVHDPTHREQSLSDSRPPAVRCEPRSAGERSADRTAETRIWARKRLAVGLQTHLLHDAPRRRSGVDRAALSGSEQSHSSVRTFAIRCLPTADNTLRVRSSCVRRPCVEIRSSTCCAAAAGRAESRARGFYRRGDPVDHLRQRPHRQLDDERQWASSVSFR